MLFLHIKLCTFYKFRSCSHHYYFHISILYKTDLLPLHDLEIQEKVFPSQFKAFPTRMVAGRDGCLVCWFLILDVLEHLDHRILWDKTLSSCILTLYETNRNCGWISSLFFWVSTTAHFQYNKAWNDFLWLQLWDWDMISNDCPGSASCSDNTCND